MLREKGERTVECLRYFYACWPLTAASRERAAKLITTLRSIQADLGQVQETTRQAASQDPALAEAVIRKVQPLLGLLAAAFSRYDEVQGQ
jgi:hypothetical protein